MRHRFGQHQRMLQKMALTPQMRQSLQLLGMPIKELNEYIEEILQKNPCLKKDASSYAKSRQQDSVPIQELTITQEENPRLTLLSQIKMLDLTEAELEIAEYLIYELDENGYIKVDSDEAAADLGVDADEVEGIIAVIQSMDPPGIGARDVKECLQLQLKRLKKENSLDYTIVTDFLSEIAAENVKKIALALKIDEKKVMQAVTNVKKLNPRPASTLLGKAARQVIPDMTASIKNKKITLSLNRDWVPRLKLYNPYEDKLEIIKDPEVKEFLKINTEAAKGLIDSLKRREETMCRVANYILTFQADSIGKGPDAIKSLAIKDVARALNMHPSTISRTVFHKYVLIKDEVVPLKSLLSGSMQKHNGETISKTSVKNKITQIVKSEDKSRPLSDEVVKKLLEQEGIKIQRRTIAKYRDSLRILPAYLRRKTSGPA